MQLIIFIIFSVAECYSQHDVFFSFLNSHTGKNLSLSAAIIKNNKHEFSLGIRYHLNELKHPDDQFNVFYKRLYATKPLHYLGLEGSYHFLVFRKWKHIQPFVFYDLSMAYSTTRTRAFFPYTTTSDGIVLWRENISFFGPFFWLEQYVGMGYKVNLTSNLYLSHKIGFGTDFIMGYDNQLTGKLIEWFDWEFAYVLNFGIGYRFK